MGNFDWKFWFPLGVSFGLLLSIVVLDVVGCGN